MQIEAEFANCIPGYAADLTRRHDAIDTLDKTWCSPQPSANVIMHTPSETCVSPGALGGSWETEDEDGVKHPSPGLEEAVSGSNLNHDESLHFNDSAVGCGKLEVVRKTTRRASIVTPKIYSEAITPQSSHIISSTDCGKKSTFRRDSRGRFTKPELVVREIAPSEKSGISISDESPRATGSMEMDASSKFPQPRETRILPPQRSRSQLATPSSSKASTPTREPPVVKTQKSKIDQPPSESPYFTPPISRSKARNSKLSESELGTKSRDGRQEPASRQPRTPKKEDPESNSKATPKRRSPAGTVSCIPFPPLSAPHFGLIQEQLAHDPFRLLIAVTFLIRTHGKHAIPVFYELVDKYPSPESLVAADLEDIVFIIRHLGLQNQRANTYHMYAKIWLEDPPTKGKRYPVPGYPTKSSGRDVKRDEILCNDDARDAWEIGHMTKGPYALDSWRIFCRDILRGEATGWNGEGSATEGFQPEWMRVLPEDKELRAYLRWMWLKEGFAWDPFTGEKEVASDMLMRAAMEGRIMWDDKGGMRIIDDIVDMENEVKVSWQ